MIKTAYETLLLKGRQMDKIESQVRQGIIRGDIVEAGRYETGTVYAILDKVDVDPFNYPLVFEMDGRGLCVAVDYRTHLRGLKLDPGGKTGQVLQGTSAAQLFHMSRLQLLWLNDANKLKNFSPLPMMLYATWIGESITRKLGLDPATQMYLTVLFGWFYYTRIESKDPVSIQKQKCMLQLVRGLRLTTDLVEETLKRVGEATFEDIYSLIKFIQQDNMNVRLDKLQLKDIYALLNVGWFGGPNAREQVDVSVEFPPVFIAMVYEAVTNRSYSKSPLSQIYQRYSRSYPVDEFKRDFTLLIEPYRG